MFKVSAPAPKSTTKTAIKIVAACALVAAATASFNASAADVRWTVTVGSPYPVVVQPVPAYYPPVVVQQPQVVYQPPVVYTQPQVVYTQPPVVYTQPRVIYAPQQVVYVQPGHGHRHGHGYGHDRHDGQRMGYAQVVYR
jgi:hypothetical protein